MKTKQITFIIIICLTFGFIQQKQESTKHLGQWNALNLHQKNISIFYSKDTVTYTFKQGEKTSKVIKNGYKINSSSTENVIHLDLTSENSKNITYQSLKFIKEDSVVIWEYSDPDSRSLEKGRQVAFLNR